MKRIGLLSDTHSHWDEKYVKYFSQCDAPRLFISGHSHLLASIRKERMALREMYQGIQGDKES